MESAYLVAVFAILFSGCSALVLITAIRSFDPPEQEKPHHVGV